MMKKSGHRIAIKDTIARMSGDAIASTLAPERLRLRILVVTAMYPCSERPGHGSFVEEQVRALRELGHSVHVVHIRSYRGRSEYLRGARTVRRLARAGGFDVVHAHYGLTALAALDHGGLPLFVTLHGSDVLGTRWQRLVSRFVCSRAATVIVVSEEIRRWIDGVVLPCGVDLERFRPLDRAAARRELSLDTEPRYVLFPFDPDRAVKRYDRAVSAVRHLAGAGVPAELLTVSGIPPDRMPLYYNASDVLLVCSDREGSPTVVKEALACNVPVVTTDVGDVRTLLGNVTGARVCDPTPESLSAGMTSVLALSRNRLQLRERAKGFDGRATAERLTDLYRLAVAAAPEERRR